MSKIHISSKQIAYVVLTVLFFSAIFILGNRVNQELLGNYIKSTGIWGPLVYVLLMTVTFVFAPLSGTPLFFAGWILFGKYFQILNYIAALIGAIINFSIAKKWGRPIVSKLAGRKNMEQIDKYAVSYGIKTLIFLRLTQGYLQDFISYAFGLTKMKLKPYILVSALAPIPWLLFWQFYVIERISTLSDLTLWFAGLTIPLYLVTIFFLWKIKNLRPG